MILVDCGLVFPDADMFGVDLVIPDFTYVLENRDRIKGLFITQVTRTTSAVCRTCSKNSMCRSMPPS